MIRKVFVVVAEIEVEGDDEGYSTVEVEEDVEHAITGFFKGSSLNAMSVHAYGPTEVQQGVEV